MRKLFPLLLAACLLCGCGASAAQGGGGSIIDMGPLAEPLVPERYDSGFTEEAFIPGHSLRECGLEFSGLSMVTGVYSHDAEYAGTDGMFFDCEYSDAGSENGWIPKDCGHGSLTRLEVFSGREPVFLGSIDLIEHGEFITPYNTYAPMAILQAFRKSDFGEGMRIKIGFNDSTEACFVRVNRTGASMPFHGPVPTVFYIDEDAAKPFIFWENEEYVVYDWLPLFLSVNYSEWLKGLEPVEGVGDFPLAEVVNAHSAAKAAVMNETLKKVS